MVILIMICALIGSVALILVCGVITSPLPSTTCIPDAVVRPLSTISEETRLSSNVIEREYEIMYDKDLKNIFKEGIVEKSIGVMRKNGMKDEAIKKKIMESFSLDEETINRLLKQ